MAEDGDQSSQPSFRLRWDVFLSFRGEDTRHSFTGRLHAELVRNGVRTFLDDEGLDRGDEIAPSLLTAIEDSAAAIAIISRRYGDSWWCLEELAKIIECRRLVLPVFYQVDPSDVRRQKGPFEEDFRKQESRFGVEKVTRWRKAMEKAGGIAGWDSRIWEESQLIQSLLKKVLTKLSNTPLGVTKYPVGLDRRVEELMQIIDVKANGVRVIGFYGMGGVGKTTLAKALYNKLVLHFKRRAFIDNVRGTLEQHRGLVSLQKNLIAQLSSSSPPNIDEVSSGIISIRGIVSEQPVLVVFDDVSDLNQLKALAGGADWFGEGSRIIITTRHREILHEAFVTTPYEVKRLNDLEALELFSFNAFGREKPPKDFITLSEQVVSAAGGLPLALEVFGSLLFSKRRIKEWGDAVQKLRQIRPGELQDVLEISFNELDIEEKCIFLDIACFFTDMQTKREDAIDILKGCGFKAELAISNLVGRSLIKIVGGDVLWMHDQLRDMGRQIVKHENYQDPGRRTRLWDRDEIINVLKNKKGTRIIEGISINFEKHSDQSPEEIYGMNLQEGIHAASTTAKLKKMFKKCFGKGSEEKRDLIFSTEAFEPMVNLRLLQINYAKLEGSSKLERAELKWLQWKGCPLETFPSGFCLRGIAVLDLSESNITRVWDGDWWSLHRKKASSIIQLLCYMFAAKFILLCLFITLGETVFTCLCLSHLSWHFLAASDICCRYTIIGHINSMFWTKVAVSSSSYI